MFSKCKRRFADRRGQGLVEYALIIAGVALVWRAWAFRCLVTRRLR